MLSFSFSVLTGNACHYSPRHPSAITVGALADDATTGNPAGKGRNLKTSSSNYGSCIDIWAPGEAITGASNEGEFDRTVMSGTSVSAAFVSGASTFTFDHEVDVAVVGSGAAGAVAAIFAREAGAETVLVEKALVRKVEMF